MVGRTDGRTDGRSNGRAVGHTDDWTDGRTDGRSDGRTIGRTDGRLVGRIDDRSDERTDGRTECGQAGRQPSRHRDIFACAISSASMPADSSSFRRLSMPAGGVTAKPYPCTEMKITGGGEKMEEIGF